MTNVLIVLVLVVVVGTVAYFMRKSAKKSAPASAEGGPGNVKGVSADMLELFQIGMEPGKDGIATVYALVTCRHCMKTKEFLDAQKIPYHFIYVDSFTSDARKLMMEKVRSYNPRGSFPTVVAPNGTVIVGHREQQLKEALIYDHA